MPTVDLNPFKEPEKVDCIIIDGMLVNGQAFSFSVRADLGDTFVEDDSHLTVYITATGQTTRIAQAHIAVVSTMTRQVPKVAVKVKTFRPAEERRPTDGPSIQETV